MANCSTRAARCTEILFSPKRLQRFRMQERAQPEESIVDMTKRKLITSLRNGAKSNCRRDRFRRNISPEYIDYPRLRAHQLQFSGIFRSLTKKDYRRCLKFIEY
jgi:hypothetical protein